MDEIQNIHNRIICTHTNALVAVVVELDAIDIERTVTCPGCRLVGCGKIDDGWAEIPWPRRTIVKFHGNATPAQFEDARTEKLKLIDRCFAGDEMRQIGDRHKRYEDTKRQVHANQREANQILFCEVPRKVGDANAGERRDVGGADDEARHVKTRDTAAFWANFDPGDTAKLVQNRLY